MLRADSAFYSRKVIAAARRGGVRLSVTIQVDKKVHRTIEAIPVDTWIEITYPAPIWDDEQQRSISRALIAMSEDNRSGFARPDRSTMP